MEPDASTPPCTTPCQQAANGRRGLRTAAVCPPCIKPKSRRRQRIALRWESNSFVWESSFISLAACWYIPLLDGLLRRIAAHVGGMPVMAVERPTTDARVGNRAVPPFAREAQTSTLYIFSSRPLSIGCSSHAMTYKRRTARQIPMM